MDDIEINFDTQAKQQSKPSVSATAATSSASQGKIVSGVPDNDSVLGRLDFRRSSHPVACVFHMAFKFSALFV